MRAVRRADAAPLLVFSVVVGVVLVLALLGFVAAYQRAAVSQRRALAAQQAAIMEREQAEEALARQLEQQRLAMLRASADDPDRERLEAEKARVVAEFLNQVLAAPPGDESKSKEILDAVDRRLAEGDVAGNPAAEAGVRRALARSYLTLARPEQAEAQIRKAIDLSRNALGDSYPDASTDEELLRQIQAMPR